MFRKEEVKEEEVQNFREMILLVCITVFILTQNKCVKEIQIAHKLFVTGLVLGLPILHIFII